MADDQMARFRTIRIQMTEIYEDGAEFPLVVSSDSTLLPELEPGDRKVTTWWVREGGQDS